MILFYRTRAKRYFDWSSLSCYFSFHFPRTSHVLLHRRHPNDALTTRSHRCCVRDTLPAANARGRSPRVKKH